MPVYRFITRNSIEKKVLLLQEKKRIAEKNLISETDPFDLPSGQEVLEELIKAE